MMKDVLGYIALSLALLAMMNKRIIVIRLVHLGSCGFYAAFGYMCGELPVFIGAILFSIIHLYHLGKLFKIKNKSYEFDRKHTTD